MQFGVERLREWFATEVLKPLVKAVDCAHEDVVNAAEHMGFPGIRLTALSELGKSSSIFYVSLTPRSLPRVTNINMPWLLLLY